MLSVQLYCNAWQETIGQAYDAHTHVPATCGANAQHAIVPYYDACRKPLVKHRMHIRMCLRHVETKSA